VKGGAAAVTLDDEGSAVRRGGNGGALVLARDFSFGARFPVEGSSTCHSPLCFKALQDDSGISATASLLSMHIIVQRCDDSHASVVGETVGGFSRNAAHH